MNVATNDINWPIMTLRDSAVANNIDTLARWCSAAGISLAPPLLDDDRLIIDCVRSYF